MEYEPQFKTRKALDHITTRGDSTPNTLLIFRDHIAKYFAN